MLLHRLFLRDTAGPDVDLSFKTRGADVSRLEGFSDAVFGFAITLLVISGTAPRTMDELIAMWHAVLPFIASFFILFTLWRAQFDFFRRYGLEDRRTIWLTGVLLMIVLIAVYPVKFLCTFVLDVLPVAIVRGDDSMKAMMTLDGVPKVLLLYAVGYAGIAFVFARLYRHAETEHVLLGLSDLERFDTRVQERRWQGMCYVGLAIIAWCLAMLSLGRHIAARDLVWQRVESAGCLVVILTGVLQRRAIRRMQGTRANFTIVHATAAPPTA
jgi:hypothetical protein